MEPALIAGTEACATRIEADAILFLVGQASLPAVCLSHASGAGVADFASYHSAFKRVISPNRQDSSSATNGGPDFASEEPCRLYSSKSEMVSEGDRKSVV